MMSTPPIAVTAPLIQVAPNGSTSGASEQQQQQPQPQHQQHQQHQQPQQPLRVDPIAMTAVAAVGLDEANRVAVGHQDYGVEGGVDGEDDEDGIPALEDKRTKRGFSKRVTLRDLERYFEYPIEEVSKMMGVSTTIIKRLCRKYGIKRWPYRQVGYCIKGLTWHRLNRCLLF